MRKAICVLAVISAVPLSCCAAMLWAWSDPRPVPLTEGLPREIAAKSPAFEARVKAAFAIGMPSEAVAEELRRQKFFAVDGMPAHDNTYVVKRYDGGAPTCGLDAWVEWRSDANGKVAEIKGLYSAICL